MGIPERTAGAVASVLLHLPGQLRLARAERCRIAAVLSARSRRHVCRMPAATVTSHTLHNMKQRVGSQSYLDFKMLDTGLRYLMIKMGCQQAGRQNLVGMLRRRSVGIIPEGIAGLFRGASRWETRGKPTSEACRSYVVQIPSFFSACWLLSRL